MLNVNDAARIAQPQIPTSAENLAPAHGVMLGFGLGLWLWLLIAFAILRAMP